MALMTFKPTSAGRRSMVRVVTPGLHKGAPHAALVEKQGKTGGRNHHGRITTRHVGGGHKQHYRLIDFKRDKEGIPARVERIEYDPNRTAHIALLCYVDGERRYIIAPKGLKAGDQVIAGSNAPIKAGNTLPLRNIPVGSTVHCIEMKPGKGAQIARAAGAGVQLIAREGDPLPVAPGDVRTISALNWIAEHGNGRPRSFNNVGQLAFWASFTDGSQGVFISDAVMIPEPSAFTMATLGIASLTWLGRQKFNWRSARPAGIPILRP